MEHVNPPVQIRLEGLPATSTFLLIPRHKPELAKNINEVHWQAVEKNLRIIVQETTDLDVFHWMEYMRNRQKEIQEGPFVNLDEDALMLKIYDGANHPLGCLKFKNLSLSDHSCDLNRSSVGGLTHRLVIHYQEIVEIPIDIDKINAQEAVDKEWQRV